MTSRSISSDLPGRPAPPPTEYRIRLHVLLRHASWALANMTMICRLLFVAANIVIICANGITTPRRIAFTACSPRRDVWPPVGRRSASSSSASPLLNLLNWGNSAAEEGGREDNGIDDVDGDDYRAEDASMRGGGGRRRAVPFLIQNIGRGTKSEIDEIVRLCIDVFFNEDEDAVAAANGDGGKRQATPPWKAVQLAYLRKFQTGDILTRNAFQQNQLVDLIVARRVYPVVPRINVNREDIVDDVRRIYNAEPPTTSSSTSGGDGGVTTTTYRMGEIIGYCEVSEKNFGLGDNFDETRRRRRRQDDTKMTRPYLSNLSVAGTARNSGVGSRLLDAGERAVRNWKNANHTEIVLQVEEDNQNAIRFYKRRGWEFVFADPTCRRYDTSGFFLRECRVTKYAMIKRLDTVGEDRGKEDTENASNLGSSLIQKLRSSFFVQKVL